MPQIALVVYVPRWCNGSAPVNRPRGRSSNLSYASETLR